MKPAILIDVDGVLNAMAPHHVGFCQCHIGWKRVHGYAEGMRFKLSLNPAHGPMLMDLAKECDADLIWMTTWQDDANTEVGPHLHLPVLPVIPCPRVPYMSRDTVGQWKARQAADWASVARVPFVWFDDEVDAGPTIDELTDVPHLVVPVNDRTGLTDEDISQARDWLRKNTPILSDSEGL